MHPAARRHAHACHTGHLSRREFLTRATALGMSASAAYALIGATPALAADTPRAGGTLRMQMAVFPPCDPRMADWPEIGNVLRGWLEPLVDYNADGTLTGHLLQRWDVSDDARSYTLHLRPEPRWWNGEAVTADHVAHNLRRWIELVAGNGLAGVLTALPPDGIDLLDERSLRLNLSRPDATIMASLSDYNALLVHPDYDGTDPTIYPLGTGPYRPILTQFGKVQVLERVPDWWGTPVFGGPWLDRIEYHDYGTDPSQAVTAAQRGDIDAVDQVMPEYAPQLEKLGWTRSSTPSAATLVVRFQQSDPLFADRRVRRAMQMAVDNAIVLEISLANHGSVAANHHVCPIHPDFAGINVPAADPASARTLMAEAGGAGDYELISLDDAWQALACDAVAAQLSDAGIPVRRRTVPGADYWANWRNFPLSGTAWNMRPLGVQILNMAYRSNAPWNETGFANPAFDAALDRALALPDDTERRAVMAELETILQDEGVIIQPFWRDLVRYSVSTLQGAAITPTAVHRHHEWWLSSS